MLCHMAEGTLQVKLRLQTLKQGKNFLDYPVVLNVITLAFKMEVGEKRVNWRDSAGEAGG